MAKFEVSTYVNAFTSITSFFEDHEFHLCIGIEPPRMFKDKQKAKLLTGNKIIVWQADMMEFFWDQLVWL